MIDAMLLGGLRRSEALGLRHADLRWGERRLFIADGKGWPSALGADLTEVLHCRQSLHGRRASPHRRHGSGVRGAPCRRRRRRGPVPTPAGSAGAAWRHGPPAPTAVASPAARCVEGAMPSTWTIGSIPQRRLPLCRSWCSSMNRITSSTGGRAPPRRNPRRLQNVTRPGVVHSSPSSQCAQCSDVRLRPGRSSSRAVQSVQCGGICWMECWKTPRLNWSPAARIPALPWLARFVVVDGGERFSLRS